MSLLSSLAFQRLAGRATTGSRPVTSLEELSNSSAQYTSSVKFEGTVSINTFAAE
jgi:hypothetical protein